MAISPSLQQQSNEPSYLLSLHKIIIQRMVAWIAQPSLSTLGSCHVYLNAVQSSIQIMEAYSSCFTIPIDILSITFGIPLTLQLEQTTNTMVARLLQDQAGQNTLQIYTSKSVACKAQSQNLPYPTPQVVIQINHLARQTNIVKTPWYPS